MVAAAFIFRFASLFIITFLVDVWQVQAIIALYLLFIAINHTGLEIAAFVIVGWVGVKLAVLTLSHPDVGVISYEFAHSLEWKLIFYGVLIAIAIAGWFLSNGKTKSSKE